MVGVSGSKAAARATLTFHLLGGRYRSRENGRVTHGIVMTIASTGGNTTHAATSGRNCGSFVVPSGMNKHFSMLAPMNLLPVTMTKVSVSRLITNTYRVRGIYTGRGVCRGPTTLCTTAHGRLCRDKGGVRVLMGFRPGLRCFVR